MVVLASVTATVISRALLGNYPAFFVPPYELKSPWELLFYAALEVLAALVAWLFSWLLYRREDVFEAWRVPEYLKPIVGGLCVGVIGLTLPQIFGVGYETVEAALKGQLPIIVLPVLVVAKLVATSLTLGSGGSGGVFSPSLFMGAMLAEPPEASSTGCFPTSPRLRALTRSWRWRPSSGARPRRPLPPFSSSSR